MGFVFQQKTTRPLPPGAEIIEKNGSKFARYRVRGKVRTAPLSEDGTKIVTKSAMYHARYDNAEGEEVTRKTGCRDEQSARQMLAGWEKEVDQIRAGILDPKLLDTVRKAATALEEHLTEYERTLRAEEVSKVYRENVLRAVRRVAAECQFATLAAFEMAAVERWFADRGAAGDSARTRNYYRESLIAFGNWAVSKGRLAAHRFAELYKADAKADPRRKRRSLTEEELGRLLAVAATRPLKDAQTIRRGNNRGKAIAKLTAKAVDRWEAVGRERALIYKTLVLTGLRADELRTLQVAQLDLMPGAAFLELDAADEKSREGNAIALRDDLAADLGQWLADTGKRGRDRVFKVPTSLRLVLDRDLRAAGIPKRDDRGRTIDVHAMRTTFGTLLNRAGVQARTAQQAMRHSDIKLTMGVYTDERLIDTRAAVEKLPALPLQPTRRQTSVTSPVTCAPVQTGHPVPSLVIYLADEGQAENEGVGVKNPGNVNENALESPSVTQGHVVSESRADRIRTCDLLVPNQ
ncbi:tyrosine-type recombinase/integrase [Limnoglobus roseus]|uniref:Integrase n=1 Tax=Limnoglobus roseus TaxID=2598579 RepID=A0A5C1ALF1_9BACT|nr:site-specific integrase [Limnoglobus roseus]QEL17728.1 integrase [Limnoglobus roseus]